MTVEGLAGKWAAGYVGQLARIWRRLPDPLRSLPAGRFYGRYLHAVVRSWARREQYFGTFFLRNRPELELMRRLLEQKPPGAVVDIAVLACSKGAEVYSVLWAIRSGRPDLRVRVRAIDISQDILDFAEAGVYSRKGLDGPQIPDEDRARVGDVMWNTSRDQNAPIFERMTEEEFRSMFEFEGDLAKIRPALKEGISWVCADAADAGIVTRIGLQDVVVANRFLCHMKPATAERCLRNVARLVRPGGHLFVSGVDLDVRTKVAREMGWKPVTDLMREIHDGDSSLRRGWPLEYWGLEPFNDTRPDWEIRYASVFRMAEAD